MAKKLEGQGARRGRLFVVHNRKGGTGKSTLACHLGIYLLQRGYPVMVLDLDDRQSDSSDFFRDRRERYPDQPVIHLQNPTSPAEVESILLQARSAGIDVVVDCPPADSPLAMAAVDLADALVTPFQAGGNDARALGRVLRVAQRASEARLLALVNRFRPRQNDDRNLSSLLQTAGVFTFVGVLGDRKDFRGAATEGLAVWELAPGSAAALEALAVCGLIDRAVAP